MKTIIAYFVLFLFFCNPICGQIPISNGDCQLGLNIPDNNCLEVSLSLANLPGTALGQDVFIKEVRLMINHSWRNDIDVNLIAPEDNLTINLINERGGSSDNFGVATVANCSNPIVLTNGICTADSIKNMNSSTKAYGLFVPEEPLQNLYLPTPINPNGTWTLQVCDDKFGDVGTLEYAELIFEPIGCPAPTNLMVSDIQATSVCLYRSY